MHFTALSLLPKTLPSKQKWFSCIPKDSFTEVPGRAQHSFWQTLRKITKKIINFSFSDSDLVPGLQSQLHKDIYLPKAPTVNSPIGIIYLPPQIPTAFLVKPTQTTLN